MRKLLMVVPALMFCLSSCWKDHLSPDLSPGAKTILIDASKDGGLWWYPQSANFSANAPHQGQALANYFRKLGYYVIEVPRGQVITWDFLGQFRKVIRFGGLGTYTQQEINAYDSLAAHSASLLFIQDHLQNTSNDLLSRHWGLNFTGSVKTTITQLSPHPITTGVSSLNYDDGSVILNPDPSKITVLGTVSASGDQQAALGIWLHPSSKIVFMGDGNGIELVPQPFTDNLAHWLFR